MTSAILHRAIIPTEQPQPITPKKMCFIERLQADGAEITVNGTMLINAVTGRKVAGLHHI